MKKQYKSPIIIAKAIQLSSIIALSNTDTPANPNIDIPQLTKENDFLDFCGQEAE